MGFNCLKARATSRRQLSPLDTHIHTHPHTHKHTKKKKKKKEEKQQKNNNNKTNLTTGYTLCDVNTEDTIRHDIALMTSTSRVYIPYPLGTIIK